jgi:hypothetical protein
VGLGFGVARMGFPMYSDHERVGGGGGGLAMVVGWMVALQGWICGGGGGGHGSPLGRVRLRGRVAWQLPTRVDKKGRMEANEPFALWLRPPRKPSSPLPFPARAIYSCPWALCAALPRTRSRRLHRSRRR